MSFLVIFKFLIFLFHFFLVILKLDLGKFRGDHFCVYPSLDGLPCGFPKSVYLTAGFVAGYLALLLVAAAGGIEGVRVIAHLPAVASMPWVLFHLRRPRLHLWATKALQEGRFRLYRHPRAEEEEKLLCLPSTSSDESGYRHG